MKKLNQLLTECNKQEKLRSRYQLIHKQYKEKSKAVVQLQEKYNDLDNKQKEQYAAYMAHQLEAGEACPVCRAHEHPAKSFQRTVLVNLVALEELKQELQEKQAADRTYARV